MCVCVCVCYECVKMREIKRLRLRDKKKGRDKERFFLKTYKHMRSIINSRTYSPVNSLLTIYTLLLPLRKSLNEHKCKSQTYRQTFRN